MAKPLEGVRVLELGQLMAGPFAGTILAYYGAEVIKVEAPRTGDPVRAWRGIDDDGTSLWWRSLGRNKKCITLDLRTEPGRDIARELAWKCDVVVENFRPGTMEKWKLGPEDVRIFMDHLPRRVSVAMYRTFLTREARQVARGRYADMVLQVPTTLAIGEHDVITRGIAPGQVEGQPNLTVEVVPGSAHWAPEQQPRAVIDWCQRAP